jgi:cysteinyl-tRNA synthetase
MAQQSSTLEKYRAAQQTVRELDKAAKQELVERYQALMAEAAAIQKELKDTFGYRVKPVSRKAVKKAAPKPDNSQTIARLKKRLEGARRNMAKATDKTRQALHDKVVELEDELRLLTTEE